MSSNWQEVILDDIVVFLNSKRVPLSSLERKKIQGKYPYYGASGIVDYINDYVFDGKHLLISEDGENLKTRNTPIAFFADGKYWVNNHAHILDEKEEGVLEYLKYYFSILNIMPYLTGAVQPKLNKKTLSSILINLPKKDLRLKINHILSTLDDRIELNRKMNQTLESMASAIFKSWFVDFDPVHAKANCEGEAELENIAKELGISKAILDLFPSEFIESELGMIPKGWEWKSFGDVVVPKRGKTITKSTITEGNIPVVAGGLSPAYYHGEYNAEAPTITISASGANAGYVNLYNENIWASDCSYINNINTKYVYSMYLFLKAQQYEITRMQQGAAQPHVYPKDLMRLMIVDCGEKFWELLEKMITPIFEKIAINQNEIQTLEKTRDTLLPKLLSGEIEL
uniref:restriction endonuclease subunit S n=1 Tax=Aliarcobacter sp. TaxID=2321116 RepID=UPI004047EAB5